MPKKKRRHISLLTRRTLALVLAGGQGSRLKELTNWRAKPAVPFGGKLRIIDFPLSNCINSNIRRIGVITQYKSHSLIRHIVDGWSFLRGEFGEYVEILPASMRHDRDSWYVGTADAVFQNLDIMRHHGPEFILILAGDHVYKMDYGPMLAHHAAKNADMTIGCIEVPIEEAKAFGVMAINEDTQIVEFAEKPDKPKPKPGSSTHALASMGIYVFKAEFLYKHLILDAEKEDSSHDFGKDIIPSLLKKAKNEKNNAKVYAFSFEESPTNDPAYWRDVGTLDAYWQANMELIQVTPTLSLYDKQWPVWTHQPQLPPSKYVFDEDDRRGTAIDSMVADGCIISGSKLLRSLIFSDVHVQGRTTIEDSVILPKCRIGKGCIIKKAILDKDCIIPNGTKIGVDLEFDRKRFTVSKGGVVLVTPEMLGQTIHRMK